MAGTAKIPDKRNGGKEMSTGFDLLDARDFARPVNVRMRADTLICRLAQDHAGSDILTELDSFANAVEFSVAYSHDSNLGRRGYDSSVHLALDGQCFTLALRRLRQAIQDARVADLSRPNFRKDHFDKLEVLLLNLLECYSS